MGTTLKWNMMLQVPVDDDTGAPVVKVSGITFDKDIDIGDVNLLAADGVTKINPAKEDGNLAAVKAKTDNIPTDPAKESGKLTDIASAVSVGNPVYGTDAAGADAYATVVTAPTRVCHHIMIRLDAGFGAIISLDGGTTDHIEVGASEAVVLDGLAIASGAAVQAKNATPGSNYANLRASIW